MTSFPAIGSDGTVYRVNNKLYAINGKTLGEFGGDNNQARHL